MLCLLGLILRIECHRGDRLVAFGRPSNSHLLSIKKSRLKADRVDQQRLRAAGPIRFVTAIKFKQLNKRGCDQREEIPMTQPM